MKRKPANQTPPISRKNILIIVFSIVLLSLVTVILNNFLKLKNISCRSELDNCNSALSAKLNSLKGQKLFKSVKIANNILKEDATVSSFSMQYLPPFGFSVNVIEKHPKFAITDGQSGIYEQLDMNGYAISLTNSTNLPVLTTAKKPDLGQKIDEEGLFALNIISDVKKTYDINKSELTTDGLVIELNKGIKVLFPSTGDRQVLIGSLILIYNDLEDPNGSKLNTSGKKIATIDLRFKNPVLK
jgi:hypothetical protein